MLNTVIPVWITNPYGDIDEKDVMIQELVVLGTTKNSLETVITNYAFKKTPVTYPAL